MRGSVNLAVAVAALVLLVCACVPGSSVPNNCCPPPESAQPLNQMQANPTALTMSVSAYPPGGSSYPSLTVMQSGAFSAPALDNAASTCISHGNASIFSTSSSGNSTTVQVQPLVHGQCVLQFDGVAGTTLIVPVTITS